MASVCAEGIYTSFLIQLTIAIVATKLGDSAFSVTGYRQRIFTGAHETGKGSSHFATCY